MVYAEQASLVGTLLDNDATKTQHIVLTRQLDQSILRSSVFGLARTEMGIRCDTGAAPQR